MVQPALYVATYKCRCMRWLSTLHRRDLLSCGMQQWRKYYLCSDHFEDRMFQNTRDRDHSRRLPGSFPSLMLHLEHEIPLVRSPVTCQSLPPPPCPEVASLTRFLPKASASVARLLQAASDSSPASVCMPPTRRHYPGAKGSGEGYKHDEGNAVRKYCLWHNCNFSSNAIFWLGLFH